MMVQESNQFEELDLEAAFAARSRQEGASPGQEGSQGVESSSLSRPDDGTDLSSSNSPENPDGTPPDPLAEMTVEQLLAHPSVSRRIQSWKDKEVAAAVKNSNEKVRTEERLRLQTEISKRNFDSMSELELVEALKDPELKAEYVRIQSLPPPPDPTREAEVSGYLTILRHNVDRLQSAGVSDQVLDELAPAKHLIDPNKEPQELLAAWQAKVDDAIFAAKSGNSPRTPAQQRSDELDQQAQNDETRYPGGLLPSGRSTPPMPDFDTTSGTALLDDAFARTAVNRGRR